MTDPIRPFAHSPRGAQPPYLHPDYGSTVKRAPKNPSIRLEQTLTEVTGPVLADGWAGPDAVDLTRGHEGAPLGERIIIAGRVLDEDTRPVPGTLLELWQCNAAGRYRHPVDQHDAPLDPNFDGVGQVVTNERGEYRWRYTQNSWRPAHIHFGVFGPAFATRLITQMYFPGDPLLALDAIYLGTADKVARERLISAYDPDLSEAEWALGYRFDIVLRGRQATPTESA